jgi:erythromycin esterase
MKYAFLICTFFFVEAAVGQLPFFYTPTNDDKKIAELFKLYAIPFNAMDSSKCYGLDLICKNVQKSEIVALGEVSHGSSDIYKTKVAIIKYLVENAGYDIVALEASMSEARDVNEYVLYGKGDPPELLKGMHFWMLDTKEMLDLVLWLRQYNQTHNHKVLFYGFDMQFYEHAISNLAIIFSKYNDTMANKWLKQLRKDIDTIAYYKTLSHKEYTPNIVDKIDSYFVQSGNTMAHYTQKIIIDSEDKKWATQYFELIKQYSKPRYPLSRDAYMAENIIWIKNNNPGSKIIVWAHNMHIRKDYTRMGQILYEKYGKTYLNLAFAFYEGSYTAEGKAGITVYTAQRAYPGTFEYYFHCIEIPNFLLNINIIKQSYYDNLFQSPLKFRITGNGKMSEEFRIWNIRESFDWLIFMEKSSPSSLLHKYQ